MSSMPIITIELAHPRQIRTGPLRTEEKRMIPDGLAGHGIVSIAQRLRLQRPNHLGMTSDAAFAYVDVASFELERRKWTQSRDRCNDGILVKERDNLCEPTEADHEYDQHEHETDILFDDAELHRFTPALLQLLLHRRRSCPFE